ncbi:MAG TPA: zinc ribbon domain-containing protein, partial [Blastocatellia bacterium]|nr:zinc ribbon domain-containing protein [Blastocatellia bacterium]
WTIVYSSFRDISSLLSFPIWIVSFTLLYFDSRVRKEAYDLELLAREVGPGFYWQPAVATSLTQGRTYVQTSPLGLAGYGRETTPVPSEQVVTARDGKPGDGAAKADRSVESCSLCGAKLQIGARFCMVCGTTVAPEA